MDLTFVNVTGRPELSRSDAKRMRAHITKTNFAHRRKRLGESQTLSRTAAPSRHDQPESVLSLPATPANGPLRYVQFLSRFWSLVMVYDSPFPTTPDEQDFLRAVASEEALSEVSIAIGMRAWSPDPSVQRRAAVHSTKATGILIRRIQSHTAHMDPVLFAVLSICVGEKLAENGPVWDIHVQGLADIITERRLQGEGDVPGLLRSFLIIDSVNHIFGFTLVYHRKIVEAIRPYGDRLMSTLADICERIIQFRRAVHFNMDSSLQSAGGARRFELQRNSLLQQVRTLRYQHEDDAYLRAATLSMKLILYLSCPQSGVDLTSIAGEMKDALSVLPVRHSIFMDLASCNLLLGAVAAREGSEVKAWFVARIRRAVKTLQCRGWERPLEVLEKGFTTDDQLVTSFRAMWKEVDS